MVSKTTNPLLKMRIEILNRVSIAIFLGMIAAGCQANERILRSSQSPVPEASLEPRKTDLATEVRDMEVAGLEHIFIIRRKDGGVFDKSDRQFLRDSVPVELNRRVATDDGKAFIFGTNFIVPAEVIATWRSRFEVEEKSKTAEPAPKIKR